MFIGSAQGVNLSDGCTFHGNVDLKVIPQKQRLPMNFLKFPWMFSTKHCFEKKAIKMIGH